MNAAHLPIQLSTQFAPAERAADSELQRQARLVAQSSLFREYLDAIPDILLVLNHQRQIVFTNQRLLTFLGLAEASPVYGRRPGEVLNCIHAAEAPGGCGTSRFCSTCGAVKAILTSQAGRADVQECRITQCGGEALDLRVWTKPVTIESEPYTIFTLLDIRDEKRRRVLEHIFFHDVLNTASNLRGYSTLLKETETTEEQAQFTDTLHQLALELIDEIQAQRDLLSAENHELALRLEAVDAVELLQSVAHHFAQRQTVLNGQPAQIVVQSEVTASLVTDRVLLRRVLGNMLKNALEASPPDEKVTLASQLDGPYVVFAVHNSGCIPPAVQLQIFQRSFSTKGAGRGLGTYSMKLLSERYLKGTVTFASSAEAGTTFSARFPLDLAEAADSAFPPITLNEGVPYGQQ
jgi:signal transduction histidine kinase